MKQCPFFGKCGGCKYDFASADYRDNKLSELRGMPITADPFWTPVGVRRRGDFCFADGEFGYYQAQTKNIVPIDHCPNLVPQINEILPRVAALPWHGAGACLITACDNGIDIAITSNVPFFDTEFKRAATDLPAIRITWNDRVIKCDAVPVINFAGTKCEYPSGGFLQPTVASESVLRDMVVAAAALARRVADLFCGLGNFTFALKADGFDISGAGCNRDLFKKPLTPGMLNQYDCVVMDPPRAGAMAQCKELLKSNVSRVIYVSCNPATFRRDAQILARGGYCMKQLVPVDQFVGSAHWEIFAVFEK